jgi:hypothetical protein
MGGRKGYNPKHKGKKSYQPILTFLAEMRKNISGSELRPGGPGDGCADRPVPAECIRALPPAKTTYGRADSGIYRWDAVQGLRKPARAIHHLGPEGDSSDNELKAGDWQLLARTDANAPSD